MDWEKLHVQAATAGIRPDIFWSLTLYEITVAIRGFHERERLSIIGRIVAIGRAFSKKDDPLTGLIDEDSKPRSAMTLRGGMNAYTFWGRELEDGD